MLQKGANYWRSLKVLLTHRGVNLFDRLPQTMWYREAVETLFEELRLNSSDAALDVGCGAGWVVLWGSTRASSMIGVDRSPSMIERAEHNRVSGKYKNVSFQLGDALQLPFTEESLDVVTGIMLLPVLPAIAPAIQEIRRVLKTGGRVGFLVPGPGLTFANAEVTIRRRGLVGFDRDSLFAWATTGRRFSDDELLSELVQAGLNKISLIKALDGLVTLAIATKGADAPEQIM